MKVVFETEFVFALLHTFACHGLVAAPQGVEVLEEFEQTVDGWDVAIWTEVCGSAPVYVACLEYAGQIFLRHSYARI